MARRFLQIQNICVVVALIATLGFAVFEYFEFAKFSGPKISVSGISTKRVVSDNATWVFEVEVESESINEGLAKIKDHKDKILRFLKSKGFSENEINECYNGISYEYKYIEASRLGKIPRYELSYSFKIASADSLKVNKVRSSLEELYEQGIHIYGDHVIYRYENFDKVRSEMIKKAVDLAKIKASNMADTLGMKIYSFKNFNLKYFSVLFDDASFTSDEGFSNLETDTPDLRVKCEVSGNFGLER